MVERMIAATGPPPLIPISKPELEAFAARTNGTTRTLKCRTVAVGRFRQEHHVRDLPSFGATVIETPELLDENTAPNPSETLLSALGSCLVVGIHANAVARAIPIRSLELEISAEINFAALWGTGDLELKPIGFEVINVVVHIEADASRPVLKALVDYATLWSPVANTLHNPVHLDVELSGREIGAA